ncbi:MAG: N-methyl-L-tryptophan oxidase [Verrucomicrobiae bacterium]|nr:N-methyl-L-tryptophan oxidase [Verrucomicrobiae bacterium]
MGSATCYHLAKRGIKVLGIEQYDLPHNQGSHHGKSRMIRQAYYEHPDYVPLLKRAYQLWEELEKAGQKKILHRTGALYLSHPAGSVVEGSLRSAREHRLPHRHLKPEEIHTDFPPFSVPETFEGFFEKDGGYVLPEMGVEEHAWQACSDGAKILTNTPATRWSCGNHSVEVETKEGMVEADQLIITTGAWTGKVMKDLGIDLAVTRQVQAWFEPTEDTERFNPENFPCWFIETDPPHGHYGFPILPGRKGLKVAEHKPGEVIPLSEIGRAMADPTEVELAKLQTVMNRYLPGSAHRLLNACTCYYTNSPDQHFIVGRHPLHDRVSFATGFSGHGYKFAPVMSEILADLATRGKTDHPIAFLSPKRLG